jgi:hypothetical protein
MQIVQFWASAKPRDRISPHQPKHGHDAGWDGSVSVARALSVAGAGLPVTLGYFAVGWLVWIADDSVQLCPVQLKITRTLSSVLGFAGCVWTAGRDGVRI